MFSVKRDFRSWAAEIFGVEFPLATPPSLEWRRDHFWSTRVSAELTPENLALPLDLARHDPFVCAGHWGPGMSSSAFYWIAKEQPGQQCFLRLPFGGAYADADETAQAVAFLAHFAKWDVEWSGRGAKRSLLSDMGRTRLKLVWPGAGDDVTTVSDYDLDMPSGVARIDRFWSEVERATAARFAT